MELMQQSPINIPSYSVTTLLNRLDELFQFAKAGFKLPIPKVTLYTHHGQAFTGNIASCSESGSITLLQENQNSDHARATVLVFNSSNIASLAFEHSTSVHELLDPSKPLPFKKNMSPLDFKRVLVQFEDDIEKEVGHKISINNEIEVGQKTIPHLCNLLTLAKQSLIQISSDAIGKESLQESVTSIQFQESDTSTLELANSNLIFHAQLGNQPSLMSVNAASEKISQLL